MNTSTVQKNLKALGWSHLAVDGDLGAKTKQAIKNFQSGYAYADLAIDGAVGPATAKAITHAMGAAKRGEGSCSPNFHFSEFACKCGGRYATCERIKLDRDTVRGLEKYRTSLGTGVSIISGYRCTSHNKAVGGATSSRHLHGDAVDLQPVQPRTKTKALKVFTGIGYQGATGKTRHVDTRPGNVTAPTMWVY